MVKRDMMTYMWFEGRTKLDKLPLKCPSCGGYKLWSDGSFSHSNRDYYCDGFKCLDCSDRFYIKIPMSIESLDNNNNNNNNNNNK